MFRESFLRIKARNKTLEMDLQIERKRERCIGTYMAIRGIRIRTGRGGH
jgi:hypothetical protein